MNPKLVTQLRQDGRQKLTRISKKTGIPVSTLFDQIKEATKTQKIRFTTLINFEELGYNIQTILLIKTNPEQKDQTTKLLKKQFCTNNIYHANNEYDIVIEAFFTNIRECENFTEMIKALTKEVKTIYITKQNKKEGFLNEPN